MIPHHPDSALVLLEKVRDINGLSLREKARYCLLWTESRDEAGLRHTSDSIISIATVIIGRHEAVTGLPKLGFTGESL